MTMVSSHWRARILPIVVLTVMGLTDQGIGARAQEANACLTAEDAGGQQRPVSLGDYWCIREPANARISKDGERIAYVESNEIHILYMDGTESWSPEIPGQGAGISPTWSGNDQALYFLSPGSGTTKLWRVSMTGSRGPQEIATIHGKVDEINLSPDQSRLLLARKCPPKSAATECPDPTTPTVITGVAFKKDGKGFSVAEPPDRVYAFDIPTGRFSQLMKVPPSTGLRQRQSSSHRPEAW